MITPQLITSSRSQLPPSLRSIPCRSDRNKDVMTKFNKLCKKYDSIMQMQTGLEEEELELQTDENEILNIVEKARNALKNNEHKKMELLKTQKKYTKIQKDCEEIMEQMNQLTDSYYPLSVQIQNISTIQSKIDIKTDLFDISQLKNVKEEMDSLLIEIQDEINEINQKMNGFKKLVRQCLNETEITATLQVNICDICNTNKINTCLNPCGHTFCNECIDKMNHKCGFCRNRFESKIKMYLSEQETNHHDNGHDDDDDDDNPYQSEINVNHFDNVFSSLYDVIGRGTFD
jgi:hypothetical protein